MPGFFDLPTPVLDWTTSLLSLLIPVPVLIALWAIAGAVMCMEVYRLVSPQQRLGRIKHETFATRQQLMQHDGELDTAWPLIKAMLRQSFQRVALVLPATLVSAYPIVALIVWMSNSYSYQFPQPGENITIDAAPLEATWIYTDRKVLPRVQLQATDGAVVWDTVLTAPVPVIHKRQWWNLLFSNPAGYLPTELPIDRVRLDMPSMEAVTSGPAWMRRWETLFFPFLFIAALIYKSIRHID